MPRHVNDHVPVGASVSLSEGQLQHIVSIVLEALAPVQQIGADIAEIKTASVAKDENGRQSVLSDAQFAELKSLLAPGHELATLMLEDYKAQRASYGQKEHEERPGDGANPPQVDDAALHASQSAG